MGVLCGGEIYCLRRLRKEGFPDFLSRRQQLVRRNAARFVCQRAMRQFRPYPNIKSSLWEESSFYKKEMYLTIKSCICHNAIRQKVMMRPFGQKTESLVCHCSRGILLFFLQQQAIANNLYFDTQELPDCPLTEQTVHGRIVWRRNLLLTETQEGRLS